MTLVAPVIPAADLGANQHTGPIGGFRNTKPLVGCTEPRIATVPHGEAVRGVEAVAFARDELNIELMPWQCLLLDRACRTKPDGSWVYRTALTIVARQQGKSYVTACRILAGMMLWNERMVIACAQSRDSALQAFRTALEIAEDAGLPIVKVMRTTGREEMVLDVGTHMARYKIVSSNSGGARGLSSDLVVLDEVREFRNWDTWAAMDKTRRAKLSSQCWLISTEGDAGSAVLDGLQTQGRAAAASGELGSLMYAEWSAPAELPASDERAWAYSNPALGTTVSADTIRAELAVDPPALFEVEVLCRRVATHNGWLPASSWDDCLDVRSTVPDGGAVVFGIDGAGDLSHVTIAAAHVRADGKTHVEAVAGFAGPTASTQAEHRLRALVSVWQPGSLAVVGKGPVEALAVRVGADTGIPVTVVGGADLDRAARSFYESVIARRLAHPADHMLSGHIDNAQGGQPGLLDLKRRVPGAPTDGAVAAVLAHWATAAPVEKAPTWVAW